MVSLSFRLLVCSRALSLSPSLFLFLTRWYLAFCCVLMNALVINWIRIIVQAFSEWRYEKWEHWVRREKSKNNRAEQHVCCVRMINESLHRWWSIQWSNWIVETQTDTFIYERSRLQRETRVSEKVSTPLKANLTRNATKKIEIDISESISCAQKRLI